MKKLDQVSKRYDVLEINHSRKVFATFNRVSPRFKLLKRTFLKITGQKCKVSKFNFSSNNFSVDAEGTFTSRTQALLHLGTPYLLIQQSILNYASYLLCCDFFVNKLLADRLIVESNN